VSTWGRSNSEIDTGLRVPLQRVQRGRAATAPRIVLLLASVAVAIAWWKPWGEAPPAPPAQAPIAAVASVPSETPAMNVTPSPRSSPSPAATVDPQVAAEKRAHCRASEKWRLVSMEESSRWRTRTLWAVTSQRASGPADPRLRLSKDHAARLVAIGICAPASSLVSPVEQLRRTVLWHVGDDGTVREILNPVILDVPLFERGEAYYGPPADEGTSWPPGRYVFEIRDPTSRTDDTARWIGLEFVPTR
jgi:hypothetical protein